MTSLGDHGTIGLEADKLRSLAEALHEIATALLPKNGKESEFVSPSDLSDYTRLTVAEHSEIVELARRFYRSRRLRPRVFSDDALFGEPAWDMLLDLFIAEADGKRLSVTAACIGSAVPTSTALAGDPGRPRADPPRKRPHRRAPGVPAAHQRRPCQDVQLFPAIAARRGVRGVVRLTRS